MSNRNGSSGGLALALLSAATFGTSGSFAASLLRAGWSPGAAVTARVGVAALLLTGPALFQLRGRMALLRRGVRAIAAYGVVAVAGAQLFFFNAVVHIDVGVALMLEYMGSILVVGWLWLRYGRRPRRLTVAGTVLAVLGLVLVLDVTSSVRLDTVGVLWGLGAAVGLAVYFTIAAGADDDLPPLLLAWSGMCVGAVTLLLLGGLGAMPMTTSAADVTFLHHRVSWMVPVAGLSVMAAVISYVAGNSAARLLGAKLASFVGLTEVLFAVLFAWVLLGQVPGTMQLVGGAVIVAGIALVRIDELRPAVDSAELVLPSAPAGAQAR